MGVSEGIQKSRINENFICKSDDCAEGGLGEYYHSIGGYCSSCASRIIREFDNNKQQDVIPIEPLREFINTQQPKLYDASGLHASESRLGAYIQGQQDMLDKWVNLILDLQDNQKR